MGIVEFCDVSYNGPVIKARPHRWLNSKTMQPQWGVEIQTQRPEGQLKGEYIHLFDGNSPLIFATEQEAKAYCKQLLKSRR